MPTRAETERTIQEVLEAASQTRIPQRLSNALARAVPERGALPPDEVPHAWNVVRDVVRPTVDAFFRDTRRILLTWTQDPVVLCCLIRNLAALGALDRAVTRGGHRAIGALRQIRGLLDLLISLLQKDISVRLDESTDLLRFLMLSVVGAVIATLDILRRSLQERLFKALHLTSDSVVRRCLPFHALIQLILRVIQDPVNGVLAKLSTLTTDWSNKVRIDIHRTYNCGALVEAAEQRHALRQQLETREIEMASLPDTADGHRAAAALSEQQVRTARALAAVQQKVSMDHGMPLLGQSGCFLRKIEFLQQLRFYRNLVDLVIQGLDRGILCANLTNAEIAAMPNPLDQLGLDGATPFPLFNPSRTPSPVYPTDDELRAFVRSNFRFDDPAIEAVLGRVPPPGGVVPGSSGPTADAGGDGTDIPGLLEQIRVIETLADCTSVMGDDLLNEVSATLRSLER